MTTTKIWPTMPHIWQSTDHDDTWSSYDDLITMAEDRGICGILLAWSLFMGEEDTRRYSDNLDALGQPDPPGQGERHRPLSHVPS